MRLVLSSDIDPDVASALRAKMGMPHQFNPPLAWAAIGYLAAIRFGALIGFSDGRTIVWHRDGRVTRWELPALDRTIAQRIAEHGTVGDRPQARPRAFPIGGLRDGRMLWSLCWHRDDEPCYVADLVLLDVERQRVDVLRCDGKREMLGTEPKCVVEADAPDVCYVTGKIDVGAAAHIDDFIMVDTCWRVDLARGTYAREPETSLRVVPPEEPLLACALDSQVTGDGLRYTGHLELERRAGRIIGTLGAHRFELDDIAPGLPSDNRWFVQAVADGPRLLVLDLRAVDRAAIHIAG